MDNLTVIFQSLYCILTRAGGLTCGLGMPSSPRDTNNPPKSDSAYGEPVQNLVIKRQKPIGSVLTSVLSDNKS